MRGLRLIVMRSAALAAALTLGLAGCNVLGPDNSHFSEPRLYSHDLFATPEACEQAQQAFGAWINCSQTALFCPSGRAELMVTDILHRGRYSLAWRRIRMTLPDNPEVGSEFRFTLSASRDTIVEERSGSTWVRQRDQETGYTSSVCSNG